MSHHSPIVAIIVVPRPSPASPMSEGLLVQVNGQPQLFPNLEAVFRAAVSLLDVAPIPVSRHPRAVRQNELSPVT